MQAITPKEGRTTLKTTVFLIFFRPILPVSLPYHSLEVRITALVQILHQQSLFTILALYFVMFLTTRVFSETLLLGILSEPLKYWRTLGALRLQQRTRPMAEIWRIKLSYGGIQDMNDQRCGERLLGEDSAQGVRPPTMFFMQLMYRFKLLIIGSVREIAILNSVFSKNSHSFKKFKNQPFQKFLSPIRNFLQHILCVILLL